MCVVLLVYPIIPLVSVVIKHELVCVQYVPVECTSWSRQDKPLSLYIVRPTVTTKNCSVRTVGVTVYILTTALSTATRCLRML